MTDLESNGHMWGEGMPKGVGAKNAGYIGLMIAKEQGKKRTDYDPTQRRKRIGKFDINKMVEEPSDYLKSAYIDKYKKLYTGNPRKTWEQVKAEASDIKHAVATWARLHPNKDERMIARETGVSQPSVNRWKRLTGQGKEANAKRKEFADMYNDYAGFYSDFLEAGTDNKENTRILKHLINVEAQSSMEIGDDILKGMEEGEAKEAVRQLSGSQNDWGQHAHDNVEELNKAIKAVRDKKMSLHGADSDDEEARNEIIEHEDQNPGGYKRPKQGSLEDLEHTMNIIKEEIFTSVMMVLQLQATIEDINDAESGELEQEPDSEPLEAPKARKRYDLHPYTGENTGTREGFKAGKDFTTIQPEEAEDADPTGAGRKRVMKLYNSSGKVHKGKYHIMEDGSVHSGATHTARSKPLIVK
jgi:hypothetical protein